MWTIVDNRKLACQRRTRPIARTARADPWISLDPGLRPNREIEPCLARDDWRRYLERATIIAALTWVLLAGATLVVVVLVPGSAWTELATPETRALYAYFLALIALAWFQRTSRFRAEQIVLALFLAGMPLIYLEAYLVRGGPIIPELLGLLLFGVLAALSLWRSPWFAVGGLALHGLGWDLWHLDSPVPAWYAVACAAIDVSLAVHAAARTLQNSRTK